MTSRRDFMRGSFALSTFVAMSSQRARAAGAGAQQAASAAAADVIAIADWTFTASAAFAEEAARHGLEARGFDGDVGGLWLHELEPALRTSRAALVGLTGAGVLFCLETMARAHGFGVVFRAERPAGGGDGWERVAARHALAAAAQPNGGAFLEPFEHGVRPSTAEPPLLAWAIARNAHRRSLQSQP